jgi:hypothetical protein
LRGATRGAGDHDIDGAEIGDIGHQKIDLARRDVTQFRRLAVHLNGNSPGVLGHCPAEVRVAAAVDWAIWLPKATAQEFGATIGW